jgi:hypothetical protein
VDGSWSIVTGLPMVRLGEDLRLLGLGSP